MTKELEFYFDFISPYAYLAHKKIQSLPSSIRTSYKPILLGGLHNLEGITAPAFIKSKLKNMINDCNLVAKKFNLDFIPLKIETFYLAMKSELIEHEKILALTKNIRNVSKKTPGYKIYR